MTNYEYSSYASSSSGNNLAGGSGGADAAFAQADANKDGSLDRSEFASYFNSAGGGGGGQ
ncbi:unnamed protein product, partial [Rotaria socialis]